MQQRYPAPYGERMSPNQLCNVPVPSPLCVPPSGCCLQAPPLLGGLPASPKHPNTLFLSSHLPLQALTVLDPSLSHTTSPSVSSLVL